MAERCHSDIYLVPVTDDSHPFAAGSEKEYDFCAYSFLTVAEIKQHFPECSNKNPNDQHRYATIRCIAVNVGLIKDDSTDAIDSQELRQRINSNDSYLTNEDQRAYYRSLVPKCTIWKACLLKFCSKVQKLYSRPVAVQQ